MQTIASRKAQSALPPPAVALTVQLDRPIVASPPASISDVEPPHVQTTTQSTSTRKRKQSVTATHPKRAKASSSSSSSSTTTSSSAATPPSVFESPLFCPPCLRVPGGADEAKTGVRSFTAACGCKASGSMLLLNPLSWARQQRIAMDCQCGDGHTYSATVPPLSTTVRGPQWRGKREMTAIQLLRCAAGVQRDRQRQ